MLINDQLALIAELKQKQIMDEETYIRKSNELNSSMNSLRSKRRLFLNNSQVDRAIADMKRLASIIDKGPDKIDELDIELFDELVEDVIIDASDEIKFKLIGGLVLKTTFILSLIALLSNGEHLPFSDTKVSGISIYQNAEDDISDTIKPRLEWHKANCKKICFIDSKDTPLFMDNDNIEKAIRETGAKLLVLDPIQSFIGNNVDMNRANSIRPLMTKLKDTAQKTGCAIVLIGHLNKNNGGKANYRGLGSIDITAASRSVLLIGKDPDNPQNRYLVQQKNNLAPIGETLLFRLMHDGVRWIGKSDVTADEILGGGSKRTKTDDVIDLILDMLEDGPCLATEIFDSAAHL